MLSFKEIKELIDLVADRRLSGLEIERAGFRVRIEGRRNEAASNGAAAAPGPTFAPSYPALAAASPVPEPPADAEEEFHYIVSPIVGTFYRSPSPETSPFVSPGDGVDKGKVLCIIEAMKLMNEIESDVVGEVVRVFPQNGQPVEFGEKLFAIKVV
jgi:acetyl-CoA carboxylase biotin carboxyl carrier protein